MLRSITARLKMQGWSYMNSLLRAAWLNRARRLSVLMLVAMVFSLLLYAADVEPRVAVLYPEIREPYLSIFLDIMDGVEDGFEGDVTRYQLNKGYDPEQLRGQMSRDGVDAIVALGKQSYYAVKKLPRQEPAIAIRAL